MHKDAYEEHDGIVLPNRDGVYEGDIQVRIDEIAQAMCAQAHCGDLKCDDCLLASKNRDLFGAWYEINKVSQWYLSTRKGAGNG